MLNILGKCQPFIPYIILSCEPLNKSLFIINGWRICMPLSENRHMVWCFHMPPYSTWKVVLVWGISSAFTQEVKTQKIRGQNSWKSHLIAIRRRGCHSNICSFLLTLFSLNSLTEREREGGAILRLCCYGPQGRHRLKSALWPAGSNEITVSYCYKLLMCNNWWVVWVGMSR